MNSNVIMYFLPVGYHGITIFVIRPPVLTILCLALWGQRSDMLRRVLPGPLEIIFYFLQCNHIVSWIITLQTIGITTVTNPYLNQVASKVSRINSTEYISDQHSFNMDIYCLWSSDQITSNCQKQRPEKLLLKYGSRQYLKRDTVYEIASKEQNRLAWMIRSESSLFTWLTISTNMK